MNKQKPENKSAPPKKRADISTAGKPVKSSNDEVDQEDLEHVTGGVVRGGWNRVKN